MRKEKERRFKHTRNEGKTRGESLEDNNTLTSEFTRKNDGNGTRLDRVADLRWVDLLEGFTGNNDFLGRVETRGLWGDDVTGSFTKLLGGRGGSRLGLSLLGDRELATILSLYGPQTSCVIATPFLDGTRHYIEKKRRRTTMRTTQ